MVTVKSFGKLDGKTVFLICLGNGSIEAEFITYGAALRSLRVPDRDGNMTDVCLGYDSAEEYRNNDGYLGAAVGRCANRISGSRFELEGKEYRLSPNEGENQLHGGPDGFSYLHWNFSCGETYAEFTLVSPDGDQGYPGKLKVCVRYTLEGSSLVLDYYAKSDANTIVSLTNHAYFNLAGHNSGRVDAQILQVNARNYTPCGAGNIPLGQLASVENTALDLRKGDILASHLKAPELVDTCGIDHNYAIDGALAANMFCPETGINMEVETSMEGLQVYTAGFLTPRRGKGGAQYDINHAVCLETQHFPNAINIPAFPSPILHAGEESRERTLYKFSIR